MNYTLKQELMIHGLIKEKMRTLHDQLNDRKVPLTDTQRDLSIRELRSYQESIYQNRLNRQIELRSFYERFTKISIHHHYIFLGGLVR
ncbi:MAG: hypothetical protein ACLSIL_16410 [Enterococcus casseliflavus]